MPPNSYVLSCLRIFYTPSKQSPHKHTRTKITETFRFLRSTWVSSQRKEELSKEILSEKVVREREKIKSEHASHQDPIWSMHGIVIQAKTFFCSSTTALSGETMLALEEMLNMAVTLPGNTTGSGPTMMSLNLMTEPDPPSAGERREKQENWKRSKTEVEGEAPCLGPEELINMFWKLEAISLFHVGDVGILGRVVFCIFVHAAVSRSPPWWAHSLTDVMSGFFDCVKITRVSSKSINFNAINDFSSVKPVNCDHQGNQDFVVLILRWSPGSIQFSMHHMGLKLSVLYFQVVARTAFDYMYIKVHLGLYRREDLWWLSENVNIIRAETNPDFIETRVLTG